MSITIRQMTVTDFSNSILKSQLISVMQDEENSIFSDNANHLYGEQEFIKLQDYFMKGKAVVSLLFDRNDLIGYVWYFKISENTVHLNEISVLSKFRGGGYGQKLINEVYKFAHEHKCKYVQLHVHESNVKARNFYDKQKFVTDKRLMVRKV